MAKRKNTTSTPASSVKVIVAGIDQNHESVIANCVSQGYGGSFNDALEIRLGSCVTALSQASSEGVPTVVFSYAGVANMVQYADDAYQNGVQLFMPMGSNDNVEIAVLAGVPSVVVTGGSSNNSSCTTAYGDGLEFWDNSPWSSNSNGIVAGKLLRIKEQLGCTWWEARHRARMTADRTETTHPSGEMWNKNNGYGRINVASALAWSGIVPPDPYVISKGRR